MDLCSSTWNLKFKGTTKFSESNFLCERNVVKIHVYMCSSLCTR